MSVLKKEYNDLLKLTREYLLQEHSLSDRILADSESYTYFRDFVAKRATSAPRPTKSLSSVAIPQAPIHSVSHSVPAIPMPFTEVEVRQNNLPFTNNSKTVEVEREVLKTSVSLVTNSTISGESPEPSASKVHLEKGVKVETQVKAGMKFVPEASSTIDKVDVSEVRKILSEKYPSLKFTDAIPSDAEAKKKARNWEHEQLTQILILSFNDSPRHNNFLENLRFAIEVQGWSARVAKGIGIENNKKWNPVLAAKGLCLVVASSSDIEACSELKKLYRESTHSEKATLAGIPLLLLADPSTYIYEPNLKSILWKNLKEKLILLKL